jgi:sterol desaturase/sphingolipid hydroxylase (fatty acid hydroxylase superfamily)
MAALLARRAAHGAIALGAGAIMLSAGGATGHGRRRIRSSPWLREQHRRHHHPRLMQRWNFNVTVPLWDWVRGTRVPREVLEAALAEDRHGDARPPAA